MRIEKYRSVSGFLSCTLFVHHAHILRVDSTFNIFYFKKSKSLFAPRTKCPSYRYSDESL